MEENSTVQDISRTDYSRNAGKNKKEKTKALKNYIVQLNKQ